MPLKIFSRNITHWILWLYCKWVQIENRDLSRLSDHPLLKNLKRPTAISDVHLASSYVRYCADSFIYSNSFRLHDSPTTGVIFTHFIDGEAKVQKVANKYSQGFSIYKTHSDLPNSRARILTSGVLCNLLNQVSSKWQIDVLLVSESHCKG